MDRVYLMRIKPDKNLPERICTINIILNSDFVSRTHKENIISTIEYYFATRRCRFFISFTGLLTPSLMQSRYLRFEFYLRERAWRENMVGRMHFVLWRCIIQPRSHYHYDFLVHVIAVVDNTMRKYKGILR